MVPASTAPLGGHSLLIFLIELTALLSLAWLLGRAAALFQLPAVSGELCAGILLGPSVFGMLAPHAYHWLQLSSASQTHLLDAVGQVGVILLVGIMALEIDLDFVRSSHRTSLSVGLLSLLIPLALGVVVGLVAPAALVPMSRADARPLFAAFVSVSLCVSSLPVVAKILADMGILHRDVGQLVIAVGVLDDVVGWTLLSMISAVAASGVSATSLSKALIWPTLFVVLCLVCFRPMLRYIFDRFQLTTSAIAGGVVAILGCAAVAQAVGLEPSFGAFMGGLGLGVSPQQASRVLAPMRVMVLSVLAPLYFAEAGLRMNLSVLARPVVLAAGLAALAVATAGKFGGAFLGARIGRLSGWQALALGAGINARGVVQIVIAGVGLQLGVLNTGSYTILILIAIATSLMAPPLLRFASIHIPLSKDELDRQKQQEVLVRTR